MAGIIIGDTIAFVESSAIGAVVALCISILIQDYLCAALIAVCFVVGVVLPRN